MKKLARLVALVALLPAAALAQKLPSVKAPAAPTVNDAKRKAVDEPKKDAENAAKNKAQAEKAKGAAEKAKVEEAKKTPDKTVDSAKGKTEAEGKATVKKVDPTDKLPR